MLYTNSRFSFFFFGESYHTHTYPQIMASFSKMNMSSNKKEKKKLGSKIKVKKYLFIDKKRCMFGYLSIKSMKGTCTHHTRSKRKKKKGYLISLSLSLPPSYPTMNKIKDHYYPQQASKQANKHVQKWGGHNLLHRDSFRCTVRSSPPLPHLFFSLLLLINDVVFPLDH